MVKSTKPKYCQTIEDSQDECFFFLQSSIALPYGPTTILNWLPSTHSWRIITLLLTFFLAGFENDIFNSFTRNSSTVVRNSLLIPLGKRFLCLATLHGCKVNVGSNKRIYSNAKNIKLNFIEWSLVKQFRSLIGCFQLTVKHVSIQHEVFYTKSLLSQWRGRESTKLLISITIHRTWNICNYSLTKIKHLLNA